MPVPLLSLLLPALSLHAAEPIRLHPENPHYFDFRGKPAVLLTSAEHYGAVLNGAFDYRKYLDTLAKDGLNMTRIFTGVYREVPGDFGIRFNTLAPKDEDYVSPYAKSSSGKYDLTQWNPAYFTRLKDFIAQASQRGIVVEVTLFCTYYNDRMWRLSPHYDPAIPNTEVLTLKHSKLTEAQLAFTRKIVTELREFDNIYYELVNEPYIAGVTLEFQALISRTIVETESALGVRHLIAQNIANHQKLVENPDPRVGLFNFHYARPPVAVTQNFHLDKAIGLDETGFDGTLDFIYRIQAWDFLLAGGAHYNNLDYSFAPGHEDGALPVGGDQPGGGSPELRKQLGILHQFLSRFQFLKMKPDPAQPVRTLSEPGKQYAVYLHHGKVMADHRPRYLVETKRRTTDFTLTLPPGAYTMQWWNPKTGPVGQPETFTQTTGTKQFTTPQYTEDIALAIHAR
ncbi:MAG: hypothetical protein JNK48_03125 [Bryobacterales bacterium]|nr:hypothetical protein [Bryobacterales bacterium]